MVKQIYDYDKVRIYKKRGDRGTRGKTGSPGKRGSKGKTGKNGIDGTVGPTGPRGFIGATGPTGATGGGGSTSSILTSLILQQTPGAGDPFILIIDPATSIPSPDVIVNNNNIITFNTIGTYILTANLIYDVNTIPTTTIFGPGEAPGFENIKISPGTSNILPVGQLAFSYFFTLNVTVAGSSITLISQSIESAVAIGGRFTIVKTNI